jgi:hypothetical protein
MKALSIAEQMNACIKHANRNGLSIDSVDVYPNGSANHQVIMYVGGERVDNGLSCHMYISVAVLVNIKANTFIGAANESTWN